MKPNELETLAKEIRDRLTHFYGQTDGTFAFPNSKEGDLLKLIEKYFAAKVQAASGAREDTGIAYHYTKEGTLIIVGMRVWCDDEQVEVVSFQPDGVEVKFFGHMGDRRCHTEVREGDELEDINAIDNARRAEGRKP